MSALGSEHHRRHFLGTGMLIKTLHICDKSTGLDRANFWIYVRHEIGVALATEKPLVLDPDEWSVDWKVAEIREDLVARHVLWICARVIKVVYSEQTSPNAGRAEREQLLRELVRWRAGLPDAFIGVPYGEEDDEGFRKIFFTVTAAGKLFRTLMLVRTNCE